MYQTPSGYSDRRQRVIAGWWGPRELSRGACGLVGGALLVEEVEGEFFDTAAAQPTHDAGGGEEDVRDVADWRPRVRTGTPARVEAENGVEAATLLHRVVGFGGQPEPTANHEHGGRGGPPHGQEGRVGRLPRATTTREWTIRLT